MFTWGHLQDSIQQSIYIKSSDLKLLMSLQGRSGGNM